MSGVLLFPHLGYLPPLERICWNLMSEVERNGLEAVAGVSIVERIRSLQSSPATTPSKVVSESQGRR